MKYHNTKITNENGTFDSKREYNRFLELQWLEKAGKIAGLQRQVPFVLIPKQTLPRIRTNGYSGEAMYV